jgi:hypothetical protein
MIYWDKVGGYDESPTMRLGLEDWEFWLRMMKLKLTVRAVNTENWGHRP